MAIPENILIPSSSPTVVAVSLIPFFLKSTSSPSPAPESRPETTEAKLKSPFIYSSVIATETAQLGIRPMKAAMTGCQMVEVRK